jgi:magnesium transporter
VNAAVTNQRSLPMLTRLEIREKTLVQSDGGQQVLVFVAPDEQERAFVAESFRLDEYDLSAALDPDEVARVETTEERAFILWKAPERAQVVEAIQLGVNTVGLVLSRDRLAVIRAGGELSTTAREFRHVEDVRDVVLGVLLFTVRHYLGHLRVIKQLSTDLEKKITVSMENRHLLQMFALGESLVFYLDAIESNSAVLRKLSSLATQLGFNNRQQQVLDDILFENEQATRQARIYSSILGGLMDARGTVVNNNMNVLLKNLTLINIVFLPLNLLASIGGMSEYTRVTGGIDWRVSYGLFMVSMVVLGWLGWLIVKRLQHPNQRPSAAQPRLDLGSSA